MAFITTPKRWKYDAQVDAAFFGVPRDPERVFAHMADLIAYVGLPLPTRYKNRRIANVPQSDTKFYASFFLAQFRRARKELYRREEEVLLQLKTCPDRTPAPLHAHAEYHRSLSMPMYDNDGTSYIRGLLSKTPPVTPPIDPLAQAITDLASAIRRLTHEPREKRAEDAKPKAARWSNRGD